MVFFRNTARLSLCIRPSVIRFIILILQRLLARTFLRLMTIPRTVPPEEFPRRCRASSWHKVGERASTTTPNSGGVAEAVLFEAHSRMLQLILSNLLSSEWLETAQPQAPFLSRLLPLYVCVDQFTTNRKPTLRQSLFLAKHS